MKTAASPDRAATATVDLACFELAGQTYAVSIAHVREILVTPAVTPLPDSPPVIEGVIDLRGTLIPVVDLARLLAGDGRATAPRSRTFVVAVREFVVGFRVERATQVVAVPVSSLESVPGLARELGCQKATKTIEANKHTKAAKNRLAIRGMRKTPPAAT